MTESSFFALAQNISLLLATALVFDLLVSYRKAGRSWLWRVPFGLLLGGIGIALMLTPWVYDVGIIFDTRSVLLGISGLFFGSVPTVTAMLVTAAFRYYQGGVAAWTGICVILASGTIGILWRRMSKRPVETITGWQLYLFGWVIHIVMLLLMFTLPMEVALQVLAKISIPVLMIYPLGTLLLGLLLVNRQRRERAVDDLKRNEVTIKRKSLLQEKLAALGSELAAHDDLETIFRIAEHFLKEMIDCPNYGITLFDPQQSVLTAAYLVSDGEIIDPISLPPLPYDPKNSSTGRSRAIASKKPVIVRDLAATRMASGGILVGSEQEPQSAIYIPMIVEDQVIGMVDLQSYHENSYLEDDGEWLSVVANQIGLNVRNSQLLSTLQQRVIELTALHTIEFAVVAHLSTREILEIVMEQITKSLGVDAVAVLRFNPQSNTLDYASGRGFLTKAVEETRINLGKDLAGQVAEGKAAVQRDAIRGGLEFLRKKSWTREGFVSYTGVSLVVNSHIIGVCEVFHRSMMRQDTDWLRTLETLAGQAALVIDHLQNFEDLQRANIDLLAAYNATIVGWSSAMDLRDKETENHTTRVTELTVRMAELLGLDEDQILHLRRGALLHDIGKLGVPDEILLKTGKLTDEEWTTMRRHPQMAYDMLSSIEYLHPALDIPYCHHEKWDGSGYPRGLKGEQIPFGARLFMIADVYDALISDRPYRTAWTLDKTQKYIRQQSGKHFDPRAVDAFISLVQSGEIGKIL
ncbi:MAG: putative PAS/PAC sensor protein [Chloroflexi bacterium]|nr:MAG: putative PAS/PAC sensor protein [Chloroflexota bacterium]